MTPRDQFRTLRDIMRDLHSSQRRRLRERRLCDRRSYDAGIGGVPGLDRRKKRRRSGTDRRKR